MKKQLYSKLNTEFKYKTARKEKNINKLKIGMLITCINKYSQYECEQGIISSVWSDHSAKYIEFENPQGSFEFIFSYGDGWCDIYVHTKEETLLYKIEYEI